MKLQIFSLLSALTLPAQVPGSNMAWEQQRMMQQLQQAQRQMLMQQSMMRMQQQQYSQMQAERKEQMRVQSDTKLAQDGKKTVLQSALGTQWFPEKPSKVIWTVPTKTRGQVPIVDGSRLILEMDDKAIQSMDADTGKPVWEASDAEGRACSPILEGNRLIYVTHDYHLRSRDVGTGKVLQDFKMDNLSHFLLSNRKEHPTVMDPIVEDGKLFVADYGKGENGSVEGRIHAYDLDSLKPLWEYPMAGGPDLAPVVAAGKVIIGGAGHVIALSVNDGKVAWYFNADSSVFRRDLTGGELIEGHYYFFSGSTLYAMDPSSGAKLWSQDLPDSLPMLMGAGDRLVLQQSRHSFGTKDWVLALDAKTGNKAWERKLGSTQMPWVQDGRVFCNSDDQIFALDLVTGQPQWTTQLEDNPELPVMPAGGAALVVTHSGDDTTIHALDVKDGKPKWTYSFVGEVGFGLLIPTGKGYFFPGEKGEVIAIR